MGCLVRPNSTYSTYSKEPGESGCSVGCLVRYSTYSTYSKDPGESGANPRDIFGPRKMWRNSFCTVLHGLPMPAHLIGSPNPLVSRAPQTQQKGLNRLREFPPSLRNASKPSARSENSNLSVIKVFFGAKNGSDQGSLDAGLKSASKNHFQRLRGSWASEAPGSRPALQPPACVSSAGPLPGAGSAASAGSPGPPCCGRSWSPRPPAAARRRAEG